MLESIGVDFEIILPDYHEADRPGERPQLMVERHSSGKALSVLSKISKLPEARPILGVDTMVVIDGKAAGKAKDEEQARDYLRRLSESTHMVVSGITLVWQGVEGVGEPVDKIYGGGEGILARTEHAATNVHFAAIPAAEIETYIAGGEWRERAGAYAIQGRASAYVEGIDGDYTNVVGLPVPLLVKMLRDIGLWPPAGWSK